MTISEKIEGNLKNLREELMESLNDKLNVNNGKIELNDHRGDLIFERIDDQENNVIQSIAKIGGAPSYVVPPTIGVWVGVYEPEFFVEIDDLPFEKAISVLRAVEREIN